MPYDSLRDLIQSEYALQKQEDCIDRMISEETDRSQNLAEQGYADGSELRSPSFPEDSDYWESYSRGLRRFWLQAQGKSLISEF